MINRMALCGFLAVALACPVLGQVPYRVADINTTATGGEAEQFLNIGPATLFIARDPAHGQELWVTDGSEAGTHLLMDIWPGPASSRLRLGEVWNGRAFFWADDGVHGSELWTSDGTVDGTHLVRDVVPGTGLVGDRFIGVPLDAFLVYVSNTPGAERAVWRTDGTEAGTQQVKVITNVGGFEVTEMARLDGRAFLVAVDSSGSHLWTTDGSPAGTSVVMPNGFGYRPNAVPQFSALGNRICWIMTATADPLEQRIGCSDGTVAGTTLLQDLPGSQVRINRLVSVGDRLIFSYRASLLADPEVWQSDAQGQAAPVAGVGAFDTIDALVAAGTQAFFVGTRSGEGVSLWRTTGSGDGTRRLGGFSDVAMVATGSPPSLGEGRVAFVADDGVSGLEPWVSDGTVSGTVLLADVSEGASGSNPTGLGVAGDQLWFEASPTREKRLLWRSGGAIGDVVPLGSIHEAETESADPRALQPFREGWVLVANDGVHGEELWFSDGTENGTYLVKDIRPGPESGVVSSRLLVWDDRVYFAADDGVHGVEPWVSDLTPSGTTLLADLRPGSESSGPSDFATTVDRVVFAVEQGMAVTDGSPAGTRLFLDQPGRRLTSIRDEVVFVTPSGLWRTDGSTAGTEHIGEVDIPTPDPPHGSASGWMVGANGMIFIAGVPPGSGSEDLSLWVTDGTVDGLLRLRDFVGSPTEPAATADGIVFGANSGERGTEPWKSDGSVAGTRLVHDIRPGPASSHPSGFLASDGTVYFRASRPDLGLELWRTEGAPSNTRLVDDVSPGTGNAFPNPLAAIHGGGILFSAQDDEPGLFAASGVTGGSRRITTGAPSVIGNSPADVSPNGRGVLFRAGDAARDYELWLLDTLCYFDDQPLWLHDGRFRVDACWRRPDDAIGVGMPVPMTEETGGFSFFNPANLDVSLKIIDGRAANGQWWFFLGSLTNVAGKVRVTDTDTGGYRDFELAQGASRSFGVIDGFPVAQPVSAPLLPATPQPVPPLPVGGGCDSSAVDLCVQDGRFRVAVRWSTGAVERDGVGVRTADNSGYVWFARPENIELLVKVHDGRPANGHFWVFLGALSNLAYTVTVTDTATGAEKAYVNARGDYQSIVDTLAFAD